MYVICYETVTNAGIEDSPEPIYTLSCLLAVWWPTHVSQSKITERVVKSRLMDLLTLTVYSIQFSPASLLQTSFY